MLIRPQAVTGRWRAAGLSEQFDRGRVTSQQVSGEVRTGQSVTSSQVTSQQVSGDVKTGQK